MNRYILVLSVICGLLSPITHAATSGGVALAATLSGDLLKDNSPFVNKKVALSQPGEVKKATYTDAAGSYRFVNFVLGKEFTVTAAGTPSIPANSQITLRGSIRLSNVPLPGLKVDLKLSTGVRSALTGSSGEFSFVVYNRSKKAVTKDFTLSIKSPAIACAANADCSDGNPCTNDTCAPGQGCVHTNNTNPCGDGQFCTVGDTCQAGVCRGTPRNCGDTTECTADTCNEASDVCENLCAAASIADTCCDDPQCEGDPDCSLPGGTFLFRIDAITQAGPSCLIDQGLLNFLLGLLESVGLNEFGISIPAYTQEPVWVTVPLPLLGPISFAAVFSGRSLVILPGQSASADLGLAGGGAFGLNCAITGEPSGGVFWDAPALRAQISMSAMTVEGGAGTGVCNLSTPGPTCTLSFAIVQVP